MSAAPDHHCAISPLQALRRSGRRQWPSGCWSAPRPAPRRMGAGCSGLRVRPRPHEEGAQAEGPLGSGSSPHRGWPRQWSDRWRQGQPPWRRMRRRQQPAGGTVGERLGSDLLRRGQGDQRKPEVFDRGAGVHGHRPPRDFWRDLVTHLADRVLVHLPHSQSTTAVATWLRPATAGAADAPTRAGSSRGLALSTPASHSKIWFQSKPLGGTAALAGQPRHLAPRSVSPRTARVTAWRSAEGGDRRRPPTSAPVAARATTPPPSTTASRRPTSAATTPSTPRASSTSSTSTTPATSAPWPRTRWRWWSPRRPTSPASSTRRASASTASQRPTSST